MYGTRPPSWSLEAPWSHNSYERQDLNVKKGGKKEMGRERRGRGVGWHREQERELDYRQGDHGRHPESLWAGP